MRNFFLFIFSASLLIATGCSSSNITKEEAPVFKLSDFNHAVKKKTIGFSLPAGSAADSIKIDSLNKKINIYFNKDFSYAPYREDNVKKTYDDLHKYFSRYYNNFALSIFTLDRPLEDLIPNFFRSDKANYDKTRLPAGLPARPKQVVTNVSKPFKQANGLQNMNIGLWHSHGWYYNNEEDKWEWQRPRLFQSVEDLVPMSFTIQYLIPMLENAGANVYVPRERDIQPNEAVVDNDSGIGKEYIEKSLDKKHVWKTGEGAAFAIGTPPYKEKENPFTEGTHRVVESDSKVSAEASFIPDIPEDGFYGIYISYKASPNNVSDAAFSVYHLGGITEFNINQQIGGSTWFYLGKFKFKKGTNPANGKVLVTNKSGEANKLVSVDAVRFGGGMGIVERNGKTSGRPKYLEGARYWLQYAGMPDSLVYSLNKSKNDYNDDYQSRNEYLNYLYGAPFGPNRDRNNKGLGVPIDISMAFHTDAGITHNDTTVGSLSIYSLEDAKDNIVFPNGMSRIVNRDLADIVQTQIVNDIRKKFDPAWNRRQLQNAQYSESDRPNFPTLLLELLSHQNFLDMKFFHDPRFRFEVSRAIYKGMLKFLSVQYGFQYVVQPLPVNSFSSEFNASGNIVLKWNPVNDSLEETAKPEKYVVYTRINDGDFDNGFIVDKPEAEINNITPGLIYSFKITAVNKGGESFPTEILSACKSKSGKEPVLIVNGFERVAAPAVIETDSFSGFLNSADAGVSDKFSVNLTGVQNDFNPNSPFRTNDAPGHGASYADSETKIIAGNSFDYPYVHGKALLNSGFSFVSTSVKSFTENNSDYNKYKLIDLILGEQKTTHWQRKINDSLYSPSFAAFPKQLQNKLSAYCKAGGNLFVSGSYTASDLLSQNDSVNAKFGKDILKIVSGADHASKGGSVYTVNNFSPSLKDFNFNTEANKLIYAAEAPDEISPSKESKTVLRYSENKFSAATAYKNEYGVVIFGFPLETVLDEGVRNELMNSVLLYFKL
jgi:hypothetical protein